MKEQLCWDEQSGQLDAFLFLLQLSLVTGEKSSRPELRWCFVIRVLRAHSVEGVGLRN